MSNFRNRFYNTNVGKESAEKLADRFESIANGKEGVTVERFRHSAWD